MFGILGATRTDELVNLRVQDVIIREDNTMMVNILKTKTEAPRSFTISDRYYLDIVRQYMNLRPSHTLTDRFFLCYRQGKCTCQVIGKHKFTKMPQAIATFLNLPDIDRYTGTYSFISY